MKNQKSQNGITLVALVVTIVVLLILAGITIMYVLSNNGIFSRARESQISTAVGHVSDQVSMVVLDMQTALYTRTAAASGGTTVYNPTTDTIKAKYTAAMTAAGITGAAVDNVTINDSANSVKITSTLTYDNVKVSVNVDTATSTFSVTAAQ